MKKISDILIETNISEQKSLSYSPINIGKKHKVNVLALGDVGTTMLIGLRLLGNDVISQIGICDINQSNVERLEMEINQINYPFNDINLPNVKVVSERELFDCDVFIFCACKQVPELGAVGDVRMAQLDANREIISHYATLAKQNNYKGLIAVVSDPVDPLAKEMLKYSELEASQVQGYGLGVMNARASYFAKKMGIENYDVVGRAFGPHGEDLVIANNIDYYDEELSQKLTNAAVTANLKVRDLGYKPYIAPALSSAALSIILTMRGKWHYGSIYLGNDNNGAFLGIKNKMTSDGIVYEDLDVTEQLFKRIQKAYNNLCNIK